MIYGKTYEDTDQWSDFDGTLHVDADGYPVNAGDTPAGQPANPAGEQHRGQLRFAERFTRTYGGRFLHVHGIDWHEYDGARWAVCEDGAEARAVIALAKTAVRELGALTGDDRAALFRDITRVVSATGVNGVLELAGSMHPCTVAARALCTSTRAA